MRRLPSWTTVWRHFRNLALTGLALLAVYSMRPAFSEAFSQLCGAQRITSGDLFAVINGGERLFHGIPGASAVSERMPLAGIAQALCLHAPRWGWQAASALVWLAPLALSLQLGLLVLQNTLGGLAALILIQPLFVGGLDMEETSLYRVLILVVANLLVWRAQAPSVWRSVLLGTGIGLSLLCRSPLFLFPLALAAFELASRDRNPLRTRLLHAAPVCLVPYLFLIPWILMNWRFFGRFIPFENGRADQNIVIGALGYIHGKGINVDQMRLAGIPAGTNALRWAVAFVLRHPLNYARAYCARLGYVAALHPVYASAALASFWPCRGRKDHGQLGFLALYFIGVYCTMPLGDRYVAPLWPIAAILAAHGAAAWIGIPREGPARAGILWPYLVLGLALGLFTLGLVDAMPSHSVTEEESFERALASSPADPWLHYLRGHGRMLEGQAPAAADDLSKALSLDDPLVDLEYFWALTAQDGATLAWLRRIDALRFGWGELDRRKLNLEMLWFVQRGDYAAGRREYELSRQSWQAEAFVVRRPDFRKVLVYPEERFDEDLINLLAAWPAPKRLALVRRLEKFINSGALAIEEARLSFAISAGNRRAALQALARAQTLHPTPGQETRIADLYRSLGQNSSASPVAQPQARREPQDIDSRLALAFSAKSADPQVALRAVEDAERLHPDARQELLIAELYKSLGKNSRASAILKPMAEREPQNIELWLALASSAGSGERQTALKALRRAESLNSDAAHLCQLGISFQELGEFARARRVFGRLVLLHPESAKFRNNLGVAEALAGETDKAIADLKEAVRLDPHFLAPYLTLGGLYASSSRLDEAVKAYDTALAKSPSKSEAGVWKRIQEERQGILARLKAGAAKP